MDGQRQKPAAHDPTIDASMFHRENRRQARHGMLFDCFRHVITDSSILYLGAGNGAWCVDLAKAGALQVIGVEENAGLIDKFTAQPAIGARERVEMRHALPLKYLTGAADASARFELVVMTDILKDISDLHNVFADVARLRPIMVLGDGVVANSDEPILRMEPRRSRAETPQAPHLIPSRGAITQAARAAGFEVDWTDWTQLPEAMRDGLGDYYRSGPVGRASFTLIEASRA